MAEEERKQIPSALNDAENEFLRFVKNNTGEINYRNLQNLTLFPEQQEGLLQEYIERLDSMKLDPERARGKVKKGWGFISDFFVRRDEYIKQEGLSVLAYGSMIYNDPRNLDYDLLVVSERHRDGVDIKFTFEKDELDENWRVIGAPGHITYISIDRLRTHCRAFEKNRQEYLQKEAEEIFIDFMNSSVILTGIYVAGNQENLKQYKKELLEMAKETPMLLAYLVWHLQRTLVERDVRRAGLADFQTGE